MRPTLHDLLDRVRQRYEAQVRLQQRYLDRHQHSGGDARRAARWLRWHGTRLVGDLLPPCGR